MSRQNATALVTGASRGIGRAIALRLAQDGFHVAINFLNDQTQAEGVANEIRNKTGRSVALYGVDVSDRTGVEKMIEDVEVNLGPISALVANAGTNSDRALHKLPPEAWARVLEVNLTGSFNCIQPVFTRMRERGNGSIVGIASVIGQSGNFGQTNYAASKAGIIGLCKSVAAEGAAYGIRCNAVTPGFIQTDMLETIPVHIQEKILRDIPMGRFGKPEEVAAAVSFLCSQDASYISGAVLNVNGAYYR